MIDTVVLESPVISETLVNIVESFSTKYQGVDLKSGTILYQFTKGDLKGSWDSKISIKVMRERWGDDLGQHMRTGKVSVSKYASKPYLVIECSVHKAMMGHNVCGGPTDLEGSARWLISLIQKFVDEERVKTRMLHKTKTFKRLGKFPDSDLWFVRRIDWAEVFDLGSFEAVSEFFRGMNRCSFPRRSVDRYGETGIYAKGRTTTVKGYHKGPAFRKQDYSRVKHFLKPDEVNELQIYANQILRFEVEIHTRKLRDDFGGTLPTVKQLTESYMASTFDREVSRLIRDSVKDSRLCRSAEAVEVRLNEMFTSDLASRLLGTWFRLSAHGEDFVKGTMKKPTFYRHRKQLQDAGVSWIGTDIILKEYTLIPQGFVPVLRDSRRITVIDKLVLAALDSVKIAA